MGEVGRVVDEGTPIEVADRAFAGLAPMPPFVLLGAGRPGHRAAQQRDPARGVPGPLLRLGEPAQRVVAAGKPAFYAWPDGQPVVDPEVAALFEKPADPVVLDRRRRCASGCSAALADEARRMLDEGVVAGPEDLDLAMITGAGFPFWNGGLTPLLDRTGCREQVTGRRFLPQGVASVPA